MTNSPSIEDLIGGMPRSLGSYAPVLEEIETALQSSECSLTTLGEAVEKDPDLTARLLRLGNSSFYGFSSRLATVTEAISLIGIQQVQDLILASSIVEQFAGVPDDFVSMESFWRHSLACGIGSRRLAMELRLPKPDKFFVAGLLHDVGRLVFFAEAPELAEKIFKVYRQDRLLLQEAEVRVLGYDHQHVGEALLRHWKYPENLVQAVAYHHQPILRDTVQTEAAVVHIADHVVNAMEIGSSGERFVPSLNTRAWEQLRLPATLLPALVEHIEEQIQAVQSVFISKITPSRK